MKRVFAAAVTALTLALAAGHAQAALVQVNFQADGDWFGSGALPYGLSSDPVITGSFIADSSLSGAAAYQSLDLMVGTQNYEVTDFATFQGAFVTGITFLGDTVINFDLAFSDLLFTSEQTVNIQPDPPSFLACNRCVTFSQQIQGVPEPATWALMIGGFGLAGVGLRRRRPVAA